MEFALSLLAQVDGSDGGIIRSAAIRDLLLVFAGLGLMAIGATVIFGSKKTDYAHTARTGLNSLVGIVIVAMGGGALSIVAFGKKVSQLLFG